jgi:hypothetical protein
MIEAHSQERSFDNSRSTDTRANRVHANAPPRNVRWNFFRYPRDEGMGKRRVVGDQLERGRHRAASLLSLRISSGSLFAAIRRASSRVSNLAAACRAPLTSK